MTSPQAQPELLTARDQLHRASLLVRRSMRYAWIGILVVGIGAALSLGLALAKERIYLSETVILYRDVIRSSYLGGPDAQPEDASSDVGQRLRELLMSRSRLQPIIERYRLYPKIVERRGYVEAVDLMRRAIEYRIGGGDTYHISFKGSTPQLAQKITNELAQSLIAEELKLRTEEVNATQRFLEAETKRVQGELQKTERFLAQFLAEHPEFAQEQVSGRASGAGASIRAAQLRRKAVARQGESAALVLKRQAARIRTQLEQGLRTVRVPPDPQLVAANEAAQEALRDAQGILAQKQADFTEKHPDVVAAKARVAAAKSRVARIKKALAASRAVQRPTTAVDRQTLRAELSNIERQVTLARSRARAGNAAKSGATKADRIVATETEWTGLNRQVREARERYLRLEERQFRASLEASSELNGQAAQMRIIDPAFEPTRPAGVGRTVVVLGGFAASCALAALLLLVLGLVDERVYDRLDVERLKLVDVLVEIPAAPAPRLGRGGADAIEAKSRE